VLGLSSMEDSTNFQNNNLLIAIKKRTKVVMVDGWMMPSTMLQITILMKAQHIHTKVKTMLATLQEMDLLSLFHSLMFQPIT
jgi:hypothetical protein